jgi:PKD repeat protein
VAEFSANPTAGYAPLAVQFTDLSLDAPTTWFWNFGDDQISTLQNPSHIYYQDGNYTVSLTATNASGSDTDTKQNYIQVNIPATINLSSLVTGKYVTEKIGRTRTTYFNATSSFTQGDEIVFRMTVDRGGTPVVGATVNINITGPNNFSLTLTSNPSNSEGVAEAKWKSAAPTRKKSGTTPGPYTATVTNVIAAGYIWNNNALSANFSINAK